MAKPHGLNPFDRAGTTVKRVFYWSFEMDKMREEFENWYSDFDGYGDAHKQELWEAWKASRAALCVGLSDLEFSKDRNGDGGIMLSERVFDAMKKAGVSYK